MIVDKINLDDSEKSIDIYDKNNKNKSIPIKSRKKIENVNL